MSRSFVLGAALWLATTAAAFGAARSLERALETSLDFIILPQRTPGWLEARRCMQCPSITLQVPHNARFFIGRDEVTLTQLKEHARGKRSNVTVFYELKANDLRRLVIAEPARHAAK